MKRPTRDSPDGLRHQKVVGGEEDEGAADGHRDEAPVAEPVGHAGEGELAGDEKVLDDDAAKDPLALADELDGEDHAGLKDARLAHGRQELEGHEGGVVGGEGGGLRVENERERETFRRAECYV